MQNLQFYRAKKKQLKLTNQAIAQQSGIPIRTIEDFFRGAHQNPRIDTVEAINKVLGIKTDADRIDEEKSLDLKDRFEWTDEEKSLGVGRRATYLSDDEWDWLELRSEVLRIKGEDYLKTLITMIEAITKEKP